MTQILLCFVFVCFLGLSSASVLHEFNNYPNAVNISPTADFGYGEHCIVTADCNRAQFLLCEGSRCGCGEHANFDTAKAMCLLNFEAACTSTVGTQPCDSGKGLFCEQEKCVCQNPFFRVYDRFNAKCMLKVQSACGTNPKECVQNSACSASSALCECNDEFTGNEAGKCVREFYTPCGEDSPRDYCDVDTNQVCHATQGICDCSDPLHMIYSVSHKKCFVKIRGPCNTTSDCTPSNPLVCSATSKTCVCDESQGFVNDEDVSVCLKTFGSYCDPLDGSNGTCNFATHTKCRDSKCSCEENYSPINEMPLRCVGNYNTSCDFDLECTRSASFGCNIETKVCQCDDPDYQIYDEVKTICQSLDGGPCNLTFVEEFSSSPIQLCSDGLECRGDTAEKDYGVCSGGNRNIWLKFGYSILIGFLTLLLL